MCILCARLLPKILNLDNQATKKLNFENESEALNIEETVTEDGNKKIQST